MQRGKGYRQLSDRKWYGPGYCGICGSRDVKPVPCRWWDPDDGWKMGVLCSHCTVETKERGPESGDFAFIPPSKRPRPGEKATTIDVLAEAFGHDMDGVWSDLEDMT